MVALGFSITKGPVVTLVTSPEAEVTFTITVPVPLDQFMLVTVQRLRQVLRARRA